MLGTVLSVVVSPTCCGFVAGTGSAGWASKRGMDAEEREAFVNDGLDPDDTSVVAAIDLVRWELSLLLGQED